MALVKVGGSNPYAGKVNTTMGMRERRPPLCMVCGERKDGIYTKNGYGQDVCPDCASPRDRAILRPDTDGDAA